MVVAVGSGLGQADRHSGSFGKDRAFGPLLALSVGLGPVFSPPRGALVMAPSQERKLQSMPTSSSYSTRPCRQISAKTHGKRIRPEKAHRPPIQIEIAGAGVPDQDDGDDRLPRDHQQVQLPGLAPGTVGQSHAVPLPSLKGTGRPLGHPIEGGLLHLGRRGRLIRTSGGEQDKEQDDTGHLRVRQGRTAPGGPDRSAFPSTHLTTSAGTTTCRPQAPQQSPLPPGRSKWQTPRARRPFRIARRRLAPVPRNSRWWRWNRLRNSPRPPLPGYPSRRQEGPRIPRIRERPRSRIRSPRWPRRPTTRTPDTRPAPRAPPGFLVHPRETAAFRGGPRAPAASSIHRRRSDGWFEAGQYARSRPAC